MLLIDVMIHLSEENEKGFTKLQFFTRQISKFTKKSLKTPKQYFNLSQDIGIILKLLSKLK